MDGTEDTNTASTEAPPTLAGATVLLQQPRLAHRLELASESHRLSTLIHCAAALALCWPHLSRHLRKRGVAYDGNLHAFGSAALEYLVELGATVREVTQWGHKARTMAANVLPGLGGEDRAAKDAAQGN